VTSRVVALVACVVIVVAPEARASDDDLENVAGELDVHADEVTVDTRMRQLQLRGHVHADAPPFHLSADALELTRSSHGVIAEGDGRLTFCPCLGTPVALGFKAATFAPPGDLFLKSPRLEIFGVPVFWLPWFWLRAPSRVGLLPPQVEWRGADGLFLGGGVHLPWRVGSSDVVVDLSGGGYVDGGFAAEAIAKTDSTSTRVRFDRLPQSVRAGLPGDGSGLVVDARGSFSHGVDLRERVAWDFDLVRGARGVLSTTDLDAASRPFDVGAAEASLDSSPLTFATGVRTAALRGGDLLTADAAGPYVSAAHDGTLGKIGTYDATVDGSVLHEAGNGSLALAHAAVGALVAGRASWIGLSGELRGVADAAQDATDHGAMSAALARFEATLPFVRSFSTSDDKDALRHRIEPFVAVSALASGQDGGIAEIASRSFAFNAQNAITAASGEAGIASAGLRMALARWARGDGLELEANAGGIVDDSGAFRGVVRWRALAGGRVFGLSGEGAHVFSSAEDASGDAFVVRARVGFSEQSAAGPSVSAHVAARDGVDPVAARLLTDATIEPAAGMLATAGYSGGIRASVPWTHWLTTRGGVEMDLSALVVTAATGSIELRDKCGCFRIRFSASHRLGRDGVDVWTTIDLVPRN
jgi:hypothetical protein